MSRHVHPASGVVAAIDKPMTYRCGIGSSPSAGCGAPLSRPGKCRNCSGVEAEERRAETVRQRITMRVPAVYRWADLRVAAPLRAALANPQHVDNTLEWLTNHSAPSILMLRGEAHSLKSTIAGACVRYETEVGRDAYFVLAIDTIPFGDRDRPSQQQIEARHVALARLRDTRALVAVDDISKIFAGAAPDSGLAAWRRGDLATAIHRRWAAKARTIVTTDLENRSGKCAMCNGRGTREGREPCWTCGGSGTIRAPGILELFGEDLLARLTDRRSAMVLRLERKR